MLLEIVGLMEQDNGIQVLKLKETERTEEKRNTSKKICVFWGPFPIYSNSLFFPSFPLN